MSKVVLISIQPKWCELILLGKKTIEVRKSRPKIETPFKCYVYETKKKINPWCNGKGKVIGEFVCDEIKEYTNYSLDEQNGHIERRENLLRSACMTLKEWRDYIGSCKSNFGYAWHISNLVIYDKPKELSEFRTVCKYRNDDDSCQYNKIKCQNAVFDYNQDGSVNLAECSCCMKRPPQSWCYVKEREEND